MMDSLRNLFRIGPGPSSSHTMAPARAARQFHEQCTEALLVRLHLFGSLAATGRGHLTDKAAVDALHPLPVKVLFHPEATLPKHPNGMRFEALNAAGDVYSSREVYSVGGGALSDDKESAADTPRYPVASMADMLEWSEDSGNPFWKLVADVEGEDVWAFLKTVYEAMNAAMVRGLEMEGILPGGLRLPRRAQQFKRRAMRLDVGVTRTGRLSAYALAVAEENAAGGVVATAPTCGSSGVVPAVLRFLREQLDASEHEMLQALAIAGLVGNVVKHNASISGAEVGCQGEIGTACAMAAAAAAWLLGGSSRQIEYAAEMGLEHHLGLTCDPVLGLVQVPCIERNAHAALRALDCAEYALLSDGRHLVTFDDVVAAMNQTGHDLPSPYRETATGGLARVLKLQASPLGSECPELGTQNAELGTL